MKKITTLIALMLIAAILPAQDLLSGLDKGKAPKDFTIATFKGTRLINFHTLETLSKGTLEFRIAHRFGPFSSKGDNLWGLDGPATIQFRLDYAPTDRLMVGIGRSSDQKIVDAFAKYRILRQTTDGSMPVSLTGLASANLTMEPNFLANGRYHLPTNRLAYMASLMVARKFNSKLSLQLSPIYTHYNIVDLLTDKNDLISLAGSFRYKFNKRIAFTAEYIGRITRYTVDPTQFHDIIGLGFDIETGGHVFQLLVTNGRALNEPRMIAYTTAGIQKGLMLGFNISRVFTLNSK